MKTEIHNQATKGTKISWLLAILLVLLTIALYWPATGYDFVNYDDGAYVYQNPHVTGGLTWEDLRWAFTTLFFGIWHPLTWVSHMLDCQLFGLRAYGHHLTSVLLHAANAGLLFVVLRRMTGARWRSALVAALFALHPLHVESVAWVAERKDVLSTFFVLLTLWAYARYVQSAECGVRSAESGEVSGASDQSSVISHQSSVTSGEALAVSATDHGLLTTDYFTRPASRFYLLSLAFFALGLMSKPMVVTLPVMLLLLDYWPLGRLTDHGPPAARKSYIVNRILLEKVPFAMAALFTCLLTLQAGHRYGSLPSLANCPITARIANAILSYARYCWQTFWPSHLAVFYPFPTTLSLWSVAGAALLLLGISVTAICLARRRPYVVVGWLWYLATLLPVIGLIQLAGYSHADRYTYVPLIGVFVPLVWGAHDLAKGWRYGGMAVSVAGSAALVLCLALTRQQLGHWQNGETLFRHALEVTENNYIAHNNLGVAFDKKGQTDEAIRQFQEALRLKPELTEAHYNLGNALCEKGLIDQAISHYQEAARLKPDYADAHNNLGIALEKKGQTGEAIGQFQEALHLKPDYAEAHYNLGTALDKQGQTDEAIGQFQQALRLKPDYAEAHYNLGTALDKQGQLDKAMSQYQEALRLKPDCAEAHYNLGTAFDKQGRTDEAIGQYQDALRLKPGYAEAHYNLGIAFDQKGRIDEAIRQYQEALRLKPDFLEPHLALAQILPQVGRLKDAAFHMDEFLRSCPRATLEAPNSPVREPALGALNDLAWLLATRPQAEERDGARAVRFAERACELTQYRQTTMVGTLAAAYAEAGRFPDAVKAAEKAITQAAQAGDQALLERNQQLLKLYRAGRPYHEPAAPVQSPPASRP